MCSGQKVRDRLNLRGERKDFFIGGSQIGLQKCLQRYLCKSGINIALLLVPMKLQSYLLPSYNILVVS